MKKCFWLFCAVVVLNAAEPKHYDCRRTSAPLKIDGKLDDPACYAPESY